MVSIAAFSRAALCLFAAGVGLAALAHFAAQKIRRQKLVCDPQRAKFLF